MDYAKESLRLHEQWQGKIEIVPTVSVSTGDELSLWPIHPAWRSPVWRFRSLPTKAII